MTINRSPPSFSAFLSYKYLDKKTIDYLHTEVPPEFRGTGLALDLAKASCNRFLSVCNLEQFEFLHQKFEIYLPIFTVKPSTHFSQLFFHQTAFDFALSNQLKMRLTCEYLQHKVATLDEKYRQIVV